MTEDNSTFASVGGGIGAGVATGAATGAVGAGAALVGFGSPGIIGGSAAASAMSAAWTSGVGTGLLAAAVTAPVAVGGAVGYGIYRLLKRNQWRFLIIDSYIETTLINSSMF